MGWYNAAVFSYGDFPISIQNVYRFVLFVVRKESKRIISITTDNHSLVSNANRTPRTQWSLEVATAMQQTIKKLGRTDRDGFHAAIDALARRLPEPPGPAEHYDLTGRLLRFSLQAGQQFHDACPSTDGGCAFIPAETCAIWCDSVTDPRLLLLKWLEEYVERFDRYHQPSPEERALRIMRREPWQALNVSRLSRQVGCSRSALVRRFKAAFGTPPAEYRARMRVAAGIEALRDPSVKVAEAARLAGFRSVKNFNNAVKRHIGWTPSGVRKLSDADFKALVDAMNPAPPPRFQCR